MRRLAYGLILCALGALIGLGVAGWYGWSIYNRPGTLAQSADMDVPRGDTGRVFSALVAKDLLPPDQVTEMVFRASVWVTRRAGALHAAELNFPAHASIRDILNVLRHAPPVQHHLTIPEGWTGVRITELLGDTTMLTGGVPMFPEGSVFPDTVSFVRDTTRAAIVARLQKRMTRVLADVWEHRDPALALSDPRALLILASIVERETGTPAERPQVAQVFLNRLRLGMKLQSDPTVVYDLSDGRGDLGRSLQHADLTESGPFNTYRIAGLPPAPICSPGRAALEAVAHPSGDQSLLYFVATGSGGHHFAASLEDHNRNVSDYRKARKAAPVKIMTTPADPRRR